MYIYTYIYTYIYIHTYIYIYTWPDQIKCNRSRIDREVSDLHPINVIYISSTYIYVYIYIERERKSEGDSERAFLFLDKHVLTNTALPFWASIGKYCCLIPRCHIRILRCVD